MNAVGTGLIPKLALVEAMLAELLPRVTLPASEFEEVERGGDLRRWLHRRLMDAMVAGGF